MRVRLRHEIVFTWDRPVRALLQSLRVTPRDHEAQHVVDWRIGADVDCRLAEQEDAFGNITYACAAEGPLESFTLRMDGCILTSDVAGVVRGSVERFPTELYLRDTPPTSGDDALRAFADATVAGSGSDLDRLHSLMGAVHEAIGLSEANGDVGAAKAFGVKQGTLADNVHILIACTRHVGLPARYVSGYFVDKDKATQHAWMEAYTEGLGWIGFDPLLDLCPQEAHVRVAVGLDALGAMPVRSATATLATPTVTSRVSVVGAPSQTPSSSQQQRQS